MTTGIEAMHDPATTQHDSSNLNAASGAADILRRRFGEPIDELLQREPTASSQQPTDAAISRQPSAPNTPFDLIVIGAGVNGAGIARDAALRGLRTLLLDKGDIGSGTTSWSSRLIHGGLRYLEHGEIGLVRESLKERERLLRIAPHLVRPLPLMIPIYDGDRRGKSLVRLGMIGYDVLSFDKSLARHRMYSRAAAIARAPGLETNGLQGAALYYDAQVEYAERLAVENALDARDAGATVLTYCRVDRVLTTGNGVTIRGVAFTDLLDGTTHEAYAPVTVNVAGPWVDDVLRGRTETGKRAEREDETIPTGSPSPENGSQAKHGATASSSFPALLSSLTQRIAARFCGNGPAARQLIGGTKGSHIVVAPFPGAPEDALYVEARTDGRPFFIIPWNGLYLIGTTDLRYDGDLDHVEADRDEVVYLIAETNRILPSADLDRDKVLYTYSGVRPLPHQADGSESGITRRHVVHDHMPDAYGLISIVGGKLTTYRELAQQTVDAVFAKRDEPARPSVTAGRPLPGARTATGDEPIRQRDLDALSGVLAAEFAALDVSETTITHLVKTYGTQARRLLDLAVADPSLLEIFDPESGAIAAEVVYAVRHEAAQTLADILLRRTMVGYGPHVGIGPDERAAAIAKAHLRWDAVRADDEVESYRGYVARYQPKALGGVPTDTLPVSGSELGQVTLPSSGGR